jgi:serine/threonine-protein kinase HipA
MPRPSTSRCLAVWLNGFKVGLWRIDAHGGQEFSYDESWLAKPESRPISLSLPLADPGYAYRGEVVAAFFDNLLPDSTEIRQRIRAVYGAASLSAFDLLAEVGRDCVGAIQLLREGEESGAGGTVEGREVDSGEIARILSGLTATGTGGRLTDEEFRISLAGAQEKTAFLWHEGRWMVPHGSTPSTHIMKLPLGKIGGIGLDMRGSVENEWLCGRIAAALGFPVARSEIARFEDKTVLVVERFDRRMVEGRGILRIPQEDFCQVTGTPSGSKYESDGGPGIEDIMRILLGSRNAERDRVDFFSAQLLFWLLAAPDGHAKNFSVFIERGGRFALTPFYDILSAYPVLGHSAGLLPPERLKLAMALRGANRHYEWRKIGQRHFRETARRCGLEAAYEDAATRILASLPDALETAARELPDDFPRAVSDPIFEGIRRQAITYCADDV